jgi:hypothetical protein
VIALQIVHRQHLAAVSALLTAACVVPYLRDIARGTTRPQRVSWFIYAVLSIVAAVSQFVAGEHAGAYLASGSAIGFTAVFIASIRRGEGGASRLDQFSLALASIGVVLSIVVEQPMIAVIAVVVAEQSATFLTAAKASRDPSSETAITWVMDGLAGTTAIAAVASFSPSELLYPIHHTCVNLFVLGAITRGRRALAV